VIRKGNLLTAIMWGGLIAGALDLTYVLTFYGIHGVALIRIRQSIATGFSVFGRVQGPYWVC